MVFATDEFYKSIQLNKAENNNSFGLKYVADQNQKQS